MCGTITWMAEEGEYEVDKVLMEVEFAGVKKKCTMMQVRKRLIDSY